MIGRLAQTILRKELRDGLRDRRSLSMALFFPLLGPVLLAVVLTFASREGRSAVEDAMSLPIAGAERAPELVAFLREDGLDPAPAPADPEKAVRAGDVDVVLAIPPEFAERLREGRPAPVRVIHDASRRAARLAAERVEERLAQWVRLTGAQRLIVRGVHPAVVEALAIEKVDVSTVESRAALLFGMMPYFLVFSMFMGGMSVAIDTTAGERERLSLEPLLANPVPRGAIALGKIGATAAFSLLALTETSLAFALLPLVTPVEALGVSLRLDPLLVAKLYVLCLPLLVAGSALMVVVAARARSFRAAQTSMSFLTFVPAIPSFVLSMAPVKERLWMKLTPALGEQLVMARLLRGEQVPVGDALLAMGASAALGLVLFQVAARLFERGRLLFDKG